MTGFDLAGRVAVVTGGTGVLGGAMAAGLAAAGARVAVLGRRAEVAEQRARALRAAGGEAMALPADVLDVEGLRAAATRLAEAWGPAQVLVNAAGGNDPRATVMPEGSIFAVPGEAFQQVLGLNVLGTVLPTQVFGEAMAEAGEGSIVNISSMAAQRPLTRVGAYGAAKAAVDNWTRWLAVEVATRYGPGVRVNALAPGFFVGDQNRALLLEPDGTPTARGQSILDQTPMGRFGEPDELIGAVVWLAGDAARFVTGAVIPVDGGFSACSGI